MTQPRDAQSRAELYHEVHGSGDPLVLVHGALGGVHSWTAQVGPLSDHYQVFVVEQRGRGHTPDIPGPFHYEQMADDTILFIERAVGRPAHLVGASDGGIIGLHIALRRPDVLRRLVTIGANFHHDGLVPESGWTDLSPDAPELAGPRQRYGVVSPDGAGHWPVIVGKISQMASQEPTLTVAQLSTIELPVLVVSGDDDGVALSHTIELYQALPQGQLAVLPGTSHAVFMEKPELVNEMFLAFLGEVAPPVTILPIRRRHAEPG